MLNSSSPLSAFGMSVTAPSPVTSDFWNFQRLSALSNDQLVAALELIPGMLSARTVDVDMILPASVKFCASGHSQVKRLACDSLILCSEAYARPDVGLLAVNILLKDLEDANPMNRSTSVDTICSMSILAEEHALKAIDRGLIDSNPKVRKAAVVGCGKIFRHSPQVVKDHNLVDKLYSMVRDTDPTVMTFSLQTINVILQEEGGVVINTNMTNYLLQRLNDCQELEQCFILDYLHKYEVKKPEMREKMVTALDPLLDNTKGPVFLAASKLFYTLISATTLDQELQDFMSRLKPQIVRYTGSKSNHQFQVALLEFLIAMRPDASKYLLDTWSEFHVKSKDSHQLISAKTHLLSRLYCCNHRENRDETETCREISGYILKQLTEQQNKTIVLNCLCEMSHAMNPGEVQELESQLLNLLRANPAEYSETFLLKARNLPLTSDQFVAELVHTTLTQCDLSSAEPVLVNLMWLLKCFNHKIPNSPYILEHIVTSKKVDGFSKHAKHLLLLTGVITFLNHPAASQHTLGIVFESCSQSGDTHLKEKVQFYGWLLQQKAKNNKMSINL